MPSLPPGMITDDVAMFAPTPKDGKGLARKMMDEQAKLEARDKPPKISSAQLKAAEKVGEAMQETQEKPQREMYIRKITAYKKKFAEKLQDIAVPKDLSKKSAFELKLMHDEIVATLGRSSGVELCAFAVATGMKWGEQLHYTWNPAKLNLSGLGAATEAAMPTTFLPLLEEFVIKYDSWFTSSVETRIVQAVIGLVMAVHRANSDQSKQFMERATQKNASADLSEKLNKLKKH